MGAGSQIAQYQKALVSYVDILGFGELVIGSRNSQRKAQRILDLLAAFKQESRFGHTGRDEHGNPVRVFWADNFSDTITRTTFIRAYPTLLTAIDAELMFLAGLQTAMAVNEQVLIRGGMAVDKFYRDPAGEYLFGPALVHAHDLAEHKAIFPRIMIDRPIARLITKHGVSQFLTTYVGTDGDNCFIDYLNGSYRDAELQPATAGISSIEIMRKHKETVEKKIAESSKKPERVKEKIRWVAIYHNRAIQRFVIELPYQAGCLEPLSISQNLIALLN